MGMLNEMVKNAICEVETKFNQKHAELLTRLTTIDGRLKNIEAGIQELKNRK